MPSFPGPPLGICLVFLKQGLPKQAVHLGTIERELQDIRQKLSAFTDRWVDIDSFINSTFLRTYCTVEEFLLIQAL